MKMYFLEPVLNGLFYCLRIILFSLNINEPPCVAVARNTCAMQLQTRMA
jgi:hypothetical protein